MIRITWVLPTVPGREEDFKRSLKYPNDRDDCEVIVVRNKPTCGAAWVEGARQAIGDYIYFGADDIEAHEGFCEAMIEAVDGGVSPAAVVLEPDGRKQSCGGSGLDVCRSDCEDWQLVDWSPTPFLKREQWHLFIEPHADMLCDLHYHSDVLVSWALRGHGIASAVRTPAVLTHYNHPVKRGAGMGGQHERASRDCQAFYEYASKVAP